MSSFPLTTIFQRGGSTTNHIYIYTQREIMLYFIRTVENATTFVPGVVSPGALKRKNSATLPSTFWLYPTVNKLIWLTCFQPSIGKESPKLIELVPTAIVLGFNLWGRGVVPRKCTPWKTGTVLEPCWNLPGTLLEPSWSLAGTLLATLLATLLEPSWNRLSSYMLDNTVGLPIRHNDKCIREMECWSYANLLNLMNSIHHLNTACHLKTSPCFFFLSHKVCKKTYGERLLLCWHWVKTKYLTFTNTILTTLE